MHTFVLFRSKFTSFASQDRNWSKEERKERRNRRVERMERREREEELTASWKDIGQSEAQFR